MLYYKASEGVCTCMAVKNETIIKKMKHELKQAEMQASNQSTMQRHVANVQLLCDLLLDAETERPADTDTITEQEIKTMISGTAQKKQTNNETVIKSLQKQDSVEGNGDSIFDF